MTLTTHILFAGAVAQPFIASVSPLGLFLIGLGSHYLIDAVPHCDYPLRTAFQEREVDGHVRVSLTPSFSNIALDLIKIGIDVLLGTVLLFLFARVTIGSEHDIAYGALALGGILPDALQSVYWFWRSKAMTLLKHIHDICHAKKRLAFGSLAIGSQLFIAASSAYAIWILSSPPSQIFLF